MYTVYNFKIKHIHIFKMRRATAVADKHFLGMGVPGPPRIMDLAGWFPKKNFKTRNSFGILPLRLEPSAPDCDHW